MLIAITLTLISPTAATLNPHLGRANYAATLARLGQADPALAQRIHDGDGPKPITCSDLLGATSNRDGTQVEPGRRYRVRITGLIEAVSMALARSLLDTPPNRWELDHHPFAVETVTCDPAVDRWSGRSSYAALTAPRLATAEPPSRQLTLEFAAPTAFKSKEMTIPVPMPDLVFGSLVERWNCFSPVVLSPEMRRFGGEMVAISRYRLESRGVDQKNHALRIGGLGTVTYRALGGDAYWLSVMQMLGDFAFYSGVGVQTATGMGMVRRGAG